MGDSPSDLDPRILAAIEEVRTRQRKPMTPIDAVLNIIRNSGWGDKEREALAAARPEDYADSLEKLSKDELRTVFREHLVEFARHKNDDNSYFKVARAAFVEACREIVARDPGSRIAWIVERRFQERGLIDELHPKQP